MNNSAMKFFTVFFLMMMSVTVAQDEVTDLRGRAEKLEKDGNWKEAMELRWEIFKKFEDEKSPRDFQMVVSHQKKLGLVKDFDEVVREAQEMRGENVEVLVALAQEVSRVSHVGEIQGGKFERKPHWGNLHCAEQDRRWALSLLMDAWKWAPEGGEKEVAVLLALEEVLKSGREGNGTLGHLQALTPTGEELDYTREIVMASGLGVPEEKDGTPVYFEVPESWAAASSDGERWRWLVEKVKSLDESVGDQVESRWYDWVGRNFGVRTIASAGWWRDTGEDETAGILQVSSLKEDETIVRMASGLKRVSLPEGYRYIAYLKKMMLRKKDKFHGGLGDQLVQIFLDRRQYETGARTLAELIAFQEGEDNADRKLLLDQIRGNWGRFESSPTFTPSDEIKIPIVFRNAKVVDLSLRNLKDDLLMQDVMAYLERNPPRLVDFRTKFSNIGSRLIEHGELKYQGEKIREWKQELQPAKNHQDRMTTVDLGKLKAGCYLLNAKMDDGNEFWSVVWVRDLLLIKKSNQGKENFYLVDAEAGAPVAGELEFFTFETERLKEKKLLRRYNVKTKRFVKKTDQDGFLSLDDEFKGFGRRWFVSAKAEGDVVGGGERRAYLSNLYLNWRGESRWTTWQILRSFGLSDRPVYRPGQEVHLKFWSREASYDLGEESKFAHKNAEITIRSPKGEELVKKAKVKTDEYGGFEYSVTLPEEATLGRYRVHVEGATQGEVPTGMLSFRVEEYKKPEFEVTVEAPSQPVLLGEEFEATVKANYYHGAPVTEAEVRIKVERAQFNQYWFPGGRWDWLYGAGYWWTGVDASWYRGWERWGCRRPSPPWWGRGGWNPPELVLDKTVAISADGTAKVKIDTEMAKLVYGNQDHRYSITAEVVDASRRTITGSGSVLAARQPFRVTAWIDRGYALTGDEVRGHYAAKTLDGRDVQGKAEARLYRLSRNDDGTMKEDLVEEWKPEGEHWDFKAQERGQYRLAVIFTDEKGRSAEGAAIFIVRDQGSDGRNHQFNAIELIADQQEYKPGETVKLLVNTDQAESRVWLFIRASSGEKLETKIISMKGKSQVVEIPLTQSDMPNIFIEGMTVAKGKVHTVTREIVLPPEKRTLNVEVKPEKDRLKPREKTKLVVKLTDSDGKPYQGSAVVSVYDKSLEYISGGGNTIDLQRFFWNWKRSFYRRGVEHSQSQYGRNLVKRNSLYMQTLGLFGDSDFLGEGDPFADDGEGIGGGGILRRRKSVLASKSVSEGSIPAPQSAAANGLFGEAESDLGFGWGDAPEVVVRSEFADLLKWVGSIETDENGEATIELEMPDNLTTWKIKTWAMGHGTKVGEGSAEIITSKDLIVRLQAPRFFVEGDEVTLSAVVHNYHEEAKEVEVSAELDGGTMEIAGSRESAIVIPAGGEKRVNWNSKALREGEVVVRMKAVTADDADAMEMTFPIFVHGIEKTESFSRGIEPEGEQAEIIFNVPEKRRPQETRLEIRYSPTLALAMVDALPYLANYPYGCTEQTLNRFVPTVVTRKLLRDMGLDLNEIQNKKINLNAQEIGDPVARAKQWRQSRDWNPVWDQKEVEKMERAGIEKLSSQQNRDGGWGWFSATNEYSYPHTTAVVVHGLILAQKNGAKIPKEMIERGVAWLKKYEAEEVDKIRNWKKREDNTKPKAESLDALVRRVIGESGSTHEEMLGYLWRDKNDLPLYAKSLLGLEFHRVRDLEKRDAVIRNIEQYLKFDDENQTAYLALENQRYWWSWYGSEFEAQAWYLKLLAAAKPESKQARGLVKYLVNNRRHATYWNSTRDTAYCLEALHDYLKATQEDDPKMTVEIVYDGKVLKTVTISKENLFTFDGTVVIAGDILTTGEHKIELRKKGKGPLYANAYLTYFSLEDFITKAGLEVKVERTYYRLNEVQDDTVAIGERGQLIEQNGKRYAREKLENGAMLKSGDRIEVELQIESKNDYEYLMFEDWKAAGLEPVKVRSGQSYNDLGAYMELRDEKTCFFVRRLPRGKHQLSYQLRAEIPGRFSALPTQAEAMYAPELRANSDEMKIRVSDK